MAELLALRAPAGQVSDAKSPSAPLRGLQWWRCIFPSRWRWRWWSAWRGLTRRSFVTRDTGSLRVISLTSPAGWPSSSARRRCPADTRRIVEDRLVFVLSHWLIRRSIKRGSSAAAQVLLPRIEVRGREHLSAALGQGRGVVAITTHLGFPHLIRTVLSTLGVGMVAATPPRRTRRSDPVNGRRVDADSRYPADAGGAQGKPGLRDPRRRTAHRQACGGPSSTSM